MKYSSLFRVVRGCVFGMRVSRVWNSVIVRPIESLNFCKYSRLCVECPQGLQPRIPSLLHCIENVMELLPGCSSVVSFNQFTTNSTLNRIPNPQIKDIKIKLFAISTILAARLKQTLVHVIVVLSDQFRSKKLSEFLLSCKCHES